jgi:hypothetical protein
MKGDRMNRLVSLGEAQQLVIEGRSLLFAGDEALLRALPRGAWIGGTTPYFMTDHGALKTADSLFVQLLPSFAVEPRVKLYGPSELHRIPGDYPEHGVSFIVMPSGSSAVVEYALHCVSWTGLFNRPLVGWVSGVDLDQLGQRTPKVFDGSTGQSSEDAAVVLHVSVPAEKHPRVDIINMFQQGAGDAIAFETEGFEVAECLVNGERRNFAEYIANTKLDTRLPLVADYNGAMVNVSFQAVDAVTKRVKLYAPIVKGIVYRQAAALPDDYSAAFRREAVAHPGAPTFACNCILNYLYGDLEGKTLGGMAGPITFGEVAYILLNQTMVYVDLE